MKISKYKSLEKFIDAPYRISGVKKNSKVYDCLVNFLEYGFSHTGFYYGTGWRTYATDFTREICSILDKLGIAHKTGNNAPRGGVHGKYVEISMPAFQKVVKQKMARRKAEEEARQKIREEELKILKEKEEKENEIARKHQAWLESEAAKLDLERFREEITSFLIAMGSSIPTSPVMNNGLSSKERGKIVWHLTRAHKGFNPAVLTQALRSYQKVLFQTITNEEN